MKYSALIGNPVEHSISPSMFNYIASLLNMEYAHLKINVHTDKELAKCFDAMSNLGFCGANVTIPYKIDAFKYMHYLDSTAIESRTVNTIKFFEGKMYGYNTDGIAAIQSIESKLLKISEDTRILIIGAGGTARAILSQILKKTKNIIIMNRYLEEAKDMVGAVSGEICIKHLDVKNLIVEIEKADLILNVTPVGMNPHAEETLLDKSVFESISGMSEKCFFDAVFNPYKTRFLREAENCGAKICPGIYMMIYQIMLAFNIWTGINIDYLDVEQVKDSLVKKAYGLIRE